VYGVLYKPVVDLRRRRYLKTAKLPLLPVIYRPFGIQLKIASPTIARGCVYAACVLTQFWLWDYMIICSNSEDISISGSAAIQYIQFNGRRCHHPLSTDILCV